MKDANAASEKPAPRPIFPELDAGCNMLAYFLHQYLQSLRQLSKRPAAR